MRPELSKLVIGKSGNMAAGPYGHVVDSSPQSVISTHSRDSSGASDNYSPLARTFSFQEQHTFSSSTSSLATTPPKYDHVPDDSPKRVSRTTLDDLVEHPEERDDGFDLCDVALTPSYCQCDSALCVRQCVSASAVERQSLDYSLADGFNSDGEVSLRYTKPRRDTCDSPVSNLTSRIVGRLPSIRRMRDRAPSNPGLSRPQQVRAQHQGVRSAPASRVASRAPSRTPSLHFPAMPRSASASQSDSRDGSATPVSAAPPSPIVVKIPEPVQPQPARPVEISRPVVEDPIDRKALASTPLLPMPIVERRGSEEDPMTMQSPLQSPTFADSPSFFSSPNSTPVLPSIPSPLLSAHTSVVSLGATRSSQIVSATDLQPLDMPPQEDQDPWATRLGHANFNIYPEPYMPVECDAVACKRLLEDWEAARREWLRHAAHTSEDYGPTSQILKLSEQKWAETDALWKRNHERAIANASARGESPGHETLAEPVPLAKMPSLSDPENSGKFPKLEDAEIVGPMVQYAKITQRHSKKTAFLKFFSDIKLPGKA